MNVEHGELLRRSNEACAEFNAACVETQGLVASLRKTMGRSSPCLLEKPDRSPRILLIAEALIAAHKEAKIDDDGYTLDLIEDALRHVGRRLAKENHDGRDFSRKRLRHHE